MAAAETERERLLRMVLEEPHLDAPRLVFADWCEEHGECERAEFIRLGVWLAREESVCACNAEYIDELCDHAPGCPAGHKAVGDVRDRAAELALGTLSGSAAVRVTADRPIPLHCFDRGFLATLPCTEHDFLLWAPMAFREQPVTCVVLVDREPSTDRRLWWWSRDDDGGHSTCDRNPEWRDYLAPSLWDRLGGQTASDVLQRHHYRQREHARRALSEACVAYGRERAGLPELPAGGRRKRT